MRRGLPEHRVVPSRDIDIEGGVGAGARGFAGHQRQEEVDLAERILGALGVVETGFDEAGVECVWSGYGEGCRLGCWNTNVIGKVSNRTDHSTKTRSKTHRRDEEYPTGRTMHPAKHLQNQQPEPPKEVGQTYQEEAAPFGLRSG